MEPDTLRSTALRFASYTDAMLLAAEQGQWDAFFQVFDERERQMALLMQEAGDSLLVRMPDLRATIEAALQKNLRIDELMRARRDELGEELASVQHQRRLRMTYR